MFCRPEFQRLLSFFPLSGSAGATADVSGSYWATFTHGDGWAELLGVSASSSALTFLVVGSRISVRCVRAREEQAIPCFFPLSGSGVASAGVSGSYLCSNPGGWHYLDLSASAAAAIGGASPATGYSVRCVRAREEQAVPLFWIVCFWSSLNLLRDWPESEASSWVSWSVSGLFSNPPEAELFPVIFRRFPRRNRSATGCVSPCLPGFQRLLVFFPLAGLAGVPAEVSGWYWSATATAGPAGVPMNLSAVRADVAPSAGVAYGYSVRCVRAREGQAIPCFFPLAGTAGAPAEVSGTYLSTTPDAYGFVYRVAVTASSAAVVGTTTYTRYASSVRCVRAREGQALPCFFPLAGSAGSESDVLGTYWATGDEDFWHNRCVLQSTSGSCVVGWVQPTTYSVRCVRAREEQAIPLFWIWFWSSLIYEGLAGVRGIQVGASERVWPVQ